MYLILSILFNVILAIIFRGFSKYQIQNLPAIAINYFTCSVIGIVFYQANPVQTVLNDPGWMIFGILIGVLFILGFNIVAQTIQFYGIAFTSIFQKVSLVITVIFAIIYFSEPFSLIKAAGLVLALAAIYLINFKSKRLRPLKEIKVTWILALPILTFLLNGSIDTLIFYVEKSNLVEAGDFQFITFLFLVAGILGAGLILVDVFWHKKIIRRKDILGGMILGIPNFFSIHFFLKALSSGLGGSQVIPINNTGIILVSAVAGFLIFNEKLTRMNIIGIACAVISILIISL
jgi:drug/metabolite transporter (DMT)-like permease